MSHELDTVLPPYSLEAEQSVLGSCLLAGANALERIEGMLTEQDFYRLEHQQIYSAIQRIANAGSPIDVITVAEAMEASGSLQRIGGLPYLGSIAQNTPSAANIKRYAEIVKERSSQRSLLAIAENIRASCAAPGANIPEIISQTDAAMVQLIGSGTDEPVMVYDAMSDAIEDIENRAEGNMRSGLLSGVTDFDELTGGLEPGQLIIIAARPSAGKTALALNIANHVSLQGDTVCFFSLEMTKRELTQRLLAERAAVSVPQMRSGKLEEDQWSRISTCQGNADGQLLFLIDRSAIGVPYVRATARKIKRHHGLSLIVIDYLGLMKGEGQTRTQEVGSLSRGLKALAKELNVPIIALAQLNRATEIRQDKCPQLSDLRDSGEIEQDADIVAMLHREELHNPAQEWSGLSELYIRKNRNGELGNVLLMYQGEFMKFSEFQGVSPRIKQSKSRYKVGLN